MATLSETLLQLAVATDEGRLHWTTSRDFSQGYDADLANGRSFNIRTYSHFDQERTYITANFFDAKGNLVDTVDGWQSGDGDSTANFVSLVALLDAARRSANDASSQLDEVLQELGID